MVRYSAMFFFLVFQLFASAQTTHLLVSLDDNNKPYLIHTVGTKENFYSIGRTYNISPRIFAPYNGLELSSGLSIGQTINIPLVETNFWQTGVRKGKEYMVPVHHQVKAKENINTLSKLYKIDKEGLVSWNNLSDEKISAGDKIIIGFLLVDKDLSPLAAQGMGPRSEPKMPSAISNPQPNKTEPQPKPAEPKIEKKSKPIADPKPAEVSLTSYSGSGYFKEEFNEQTNNGRKVQTNTFKGGSFKSTSGWTDGKFYILIDGIEKGTIVQLINSVNNKKVYAKVLASIAETKPGASESFLISNATAGQLDLQNANFELEISWSK
jgi:hypothetical protein